MTAKKQSYDWRWTARMYEMRYPQEKVSVAEPYWSGKVKILAKKTRKRPRKPYLQRKS